MLASIYLDFSTIYVGGRVAAQEVNYVRHFFDATKASHRQFFYNLVSAGR